MFLKRDSNSKAAYAERNFGIGFFIIFVTALVLHFGIESSYGMGYFHHSSKKPPTIIQGYISDARTNQPLSGVEVKLKSFFGQLKASTSTNSNGYYKFSFGTLGSVYVLSFKKQCYLVKSTTKLFYNYQTITINYDLIPESDRVPPVISITKPVKLLTNQDVTIEYTVRDNITPSNEIHVSGNQSPYTTDGTYNVTLTAKDKANNTSTAKVNFTIDKTLPTGTIQINNNPQAVKYTKDGSVTLNFTAQDNAGGSGIFQMQLSNDKVNWSMPVPYAITKSWTIAEGEGERTVYVKFSDKAGNWSPVYSDSIILDTIAPVMKFILPLNESTVSGSDEEAKL